MNGSPTASRPLRSRTNIRPTSAVSAIASALQNVTRMAPRHRPAPPAPAASAPSPARLISHAIVTMPMISRVGTSAEMMSRSAAPTEMSPPMQAPPESVSRLALRLYQARREREHPTDLQH